jgi:hypothetical protein
MKSDPPECELTIPTIDLMIDAYESDPIGFAWIIPELIDMTCMEDQRYIP